MLFHPLLLFVGAALYLALRHVQSDREVWRLTRLTRVEIGRWVGAQVVVTQPLVELYGGRMAVIKVS